MKKLIFFFERFEIYDVNVLCKHTVNLCNYSNYQARLFGEKSQWWHTSFLLASRHFQNEMSSFYYIGCCLPHQNSHIELVKANVKMD